MAEQVKIQAAARDETGKAVAGRLRADGRVPAVVYGPKMDSTTVHVDALDLYHALHTPAGLNVLVRLQVDGDEVLTMPRELQRHPVRGDLFHVDFVAIDRDTLVRVEIPVHIENVGEVETPGVATQVLHQVPIRVPPLDIPDYFELDATGMAIGDVLRVEDIDLPEGAEFDIELDRTVLTVSAPTIVEEEEDEETELAPGLAELMEGLEEGEELSQEELAERLEAAREAGEIEAPEDVEAEGEGPSTGE